MSNRKLGAFVAVLALCLAIATPAGAGMRPRYGGTVAVALPQAEPGLDPAQASTVAELFVATLLHQAPLRRGPDGTLTPVLLAEPPRSDDGGRTFVLRLRPGLRFHDGSPIRAGDLAATLRRLAQGPWAALALPVSAMSTRSETELEVRLAFPYPRWPEALAEVGASVLPAGNTGTGAGPFRVAARPAGGLRLEAWAENAAGRPFLDAVLLLQAPDRRGAARLVGEGAAELGPGRVTEAPLATWLFVAPGLTVDLDAIDPSDLVRYFVPGAATPMQRLLPPPHQAPPPAAAAAGRPGRTLDLLHDPAVEGHRQVAERIQLRLHDRGIETRLVAVGQDELHRRAGADAYELALVQLPLPADPGLAAATLLHGAGRKAAARALLTRVGAAGPAREAAARATAQALAGVRGIVPLYAATEAILPLRGDLQEARDLADAWRLPTHAEGDAPR